MCVEAIAAGANIYGATQKAGTEAEATRRAEKRKRLLEERAYGQAERRFTTGREDLGTGEQAFLGETAAAPELLAKIRENIVRGQTEAQQTGLGQLRLGLAAQGVRGGQAATLYGRGARKMGTELQETVDRMALEEALKRRELRAGYFGAKAGRGQSAAATV